MLFSSRRAAVFSTLATALVLPAQVFAQQPKGWPKLDALRSGAVEFSPIDRKEKPTTAGSYLAARHASVERDAGAAASFYRSALKTDPKNAELLDRAFISTLADGDIDEAVKLAERILQTDKNNRIARLVVGVRALKQKQYAQAQQNINQSGTGRASRARRVRAGGDRHGVIRRSGAAAISDTHKAEAEWTRAAGGCGRQGRPARASAQGDARGNRD